MKAALRHRMRLAFVGFALLNAGCYDVDSFLHLFHGDGGAGAAGDAPASSDGPLPFDAPLGDLTAADAPGVGPIDLQLTGDLALPATCADALVDGNETDVDCGGACRPCRPGKRCKLDGDCTSRSCSGNRCALASGPPRWRPVTNFPVPRSQLAAYGYSDGRVYAFGGVDALGQAQATAYAYAIDGGTWTRLPDLSTPRAGCAAASGAYGGIYALGGQNQSGYLGSVEIYVPAMKQWTAAAPMPTPRAFLAASAGGIVYAIGGSNGSDLATVEAFNSGGNFWGVAASLSTPRSALGAALAYDGNIYAAGGSSKGLPLSSAEGFSSTSLQWGPSAPLSAARASLAVAVAGDTRFYAIGGAGGGGTLASVEALDTTLNQWFPVAPLSHPRKAHAAAVGSDGRIYVVGETGGGLSVEAYGPTIALSATGGPAGTSLTVTGGNFAAFATVTIYFATQQSAPLGTGTTDGAGTLGAPIAIKIPPGPPKAYPMVAVDDLSAFPANANFTIK